MYFQGLINYKYSDNNQPMKKLFLAATLLYSLSTYSQQILSEQERAIVVDEILADRFDKLLPELMDISEIDMWIVISREYNEDPVMLLG